MPKRKETNSTGPGLFSKGQRVLCYDRGAPYPAKILDINRKDSERGYKVHYFGWNPRHDEWVAQDRIMIDSEKNRKKMKNEKIEQKATPVEMEVSKKPKPAEKLRRSAREKLAGSSGNVAATVRVSKTRRSSEQQNLVVLRSCPKVPQQRPTPSSQGLKISDELIQILKEDKDWVVNKKQVPYFGYKKWTVETVLDAWANDILRQTNASRPEAQELFCQAFNKLCFDELLYPNEQVHFLGLSEPFQREPSRCCGVVLLIRLIYFLLINAHKAEKCEEAEELLKDLMGFLHTNAFRFGIQTRNGQP